MSENKAKESENSPNLANLNLNEEGSSGQEPGLNAEEELLKIDDDDLPEELDKATEEALLKDDVKGEEEDVDVEMSEDDVLGEAPIPIAEDDVSVVSDRQTNNDEEVEFIQVDGSSTHSNSNSNDGVTSGAEEDSEAKKAIRLVEKARRDEMKFMADFDPRQSNRIQRKRVRKRYNAGDGRIVIYADDFENCDCLRDGCPGCHLPCRHCGDHRCGVDCRVNRRYVYDAVELEGRNIEIRNTQNS